MTANPEVQGTDSALRAGQVWIARGRDAIRWRVESVEADLVTVTSERTGYTPLPVLHGEFLSCMAMKAEEA